MGRKLSILVAITCLAINAMIAMAFWEEAALWLGFYREMRGTPVLAGREAEDQAKQGMRTQRIKLDLDEIEWVRQPYGMEEETSLREYVVIPVKQTLLTTPETIAPQFDRAPESYISMSCFGAGVANLMLYDRKNDSFKLIFYSHLAIASYETMITAQEPVLTVFAITEDVNKDGLLSCLDGADLYVYGLVSSNLKKISFAANEHPLHIVDFDHEQVAVTLGIDDNGDGLVDRLEKSTTLARVNLATGEVERFLPPELLDRAQALLEGSATTGP